MVAISLYRGNLHRVPDVPRRWLTPTPKISLRDFKTLLSRRNRALSRLRLRSTATTVTFNPNSYSKLQAETEKRNGLSLLRSKSEETDKAGDCQEEGGNVDKIEEIEDQKTLDGGDCLVKPVDEAKVAADKAADAVDGDGKLQSSEIVEKPAERPELAERSELANPNEQTSDKVYMQDDKEKRKREIKEKLETLNAKKHNLVQALKQILNAEEELKRCNCVQGMATCPSGTLQVEVTNDPGLLTRHTTPRIGSEANLGGDAEGAEAEDASNQNAHSRHTLGMSSRSPFLESPLRRLTYFQHNAVPHPSRASLGVTGSPSRFAPTGHQGNSGNLPAVSVSGTNYIASSPSPAASGGTSVVRDARQPSPWN